MNKVDILLRFAPNEDDVDAQLAQRFIEVAEQINSMEIDSREKTIAIERLEESYMWAKKGRIESDDMSFEE